MLNTVTKTSLTFAVEIHVSQKMNLNDDDPLTHITASLEDLTQRSLISPEKKKKLNKLLVTVMWFPHGSVID